MRATLSALFLFGLACAGGSGPAQEAERTGASAPSDDAARLAHNGDAPVAEAAPVAPEPEAGLADHWLVILASKHDSAEAAAVLDTLRPPADLPVHPRTLRSSRFKNLMPCYTVAVADATPDKKAALALSKALRGAGVDNYVKNAGGYVGVSAALDAWCGGTDAAAVGEARVAALVDGALWLPEVVSGADLAALEAAAPEPMTVGEGYAAWVQPLPAASGGARVRVVDGASGRAQVCTTDTRALLTLGTPHFGTLEGPQPPAAPTCGSPALYTRLACPDAVEGGRWIAVAEGERLEGYAALGTSPALEAAAKAALITGTDWGGVPEIGSDEELDVDRTVVATRWHAASGDILLVEGERTYGNGVCGGDGATWIGVYALAGDTVGAQLGTWTQRTFADLVGVVDVGGDGRPEVIVEEFPQSTFLVDTDGGAVGELSVGYCDCPC